MGRLTPSAVALSAAALVAVGGGAYSLAATSGATITVCIGHKSGTFYKARKCARHDKKLSFNKQGPPGIQGPKGTAGTSVTSTSLPAGNSSCPNGGSSFSASNGTTFACNGAPGPGATTFTTTLPQGSLSTLMPLMTLANGITVQGGCIASSVAVEVVGPTGTSTLQASGTKSNDSTLTTVDIDQASVGPLAAGSTSSDIDVLARDAATGGKFAHIDVHGTHGSPCTYWGMIIPSG
jgi:hypothetical protein